jgi:hypothetical protein
MSIQHPDSVGKVRKILRFETIFHASASDCTKLTLERELKSEPRLGLATTFQSVRWHLYRKVSVLILNQSRETLCSDLE